MRTDRFARARRTFSRLPLIAMLLVSALGPPAAPGSAAVPDPVTRLQVVVNSVQILDDREGAFSGKGEMDFSARLWICNEAAFPHCEIENGHVRHGTMLTAFDTRINAYTGDTVTLDRVLPDDGNVLAGAGVSQKLGFPVFAGPHYVLIFNMVESDGGYTASEQMGSWHQRIDIGEHGLDVGTHVERSRRPDGVHVGDYIVTYEVRVTPVPELRASNIRILDLPGSTKKLGCIAIQNVGGADAGPFDAALYVDNTLPPGATIRAGTLAAFNGVELCVEAELPASGQHTLRAVVDVYKTVDEWDETNNAYEQAYTGPQQATSPPTEAENKPAPATTGSDAKSSPSSSVPVTLPAPGQGQADLVVTTIKVNGQVPDGKDDCKDGKNTVTVAVKNAGAGKAATFVVGLDTDGDEAGVRCLAEMSSPGHAAAPDRPYARL